MQTGIAGSLESNDALITVQPAPKLDIIINSIVADFFYEQIENVIRETLADLNISKVKVVCNDKGALDYTIRARLVTALQRMQL